MCVRLAVVLLYLCVFSVVSHAQVFGRLSGRVIDPAGAAVSSASVSVVNQDTAARYAAATNGEGVFVAPQLDAGFYTVRVEASGFRAAEARDVKVDTNKEYSMAPMRLEIGAVQETVTVSAGMNLVQTANAEVSSTFYTDQIKYLPLASRNPLNLIQLQAGAGFNGRGTTVINGTRASFSNVTAEGINIQDNFIRTNDLDFLPTMPFLGQVGEITIITQNADPSAGNGSSQVAFRTPSGTNDYHGEVFWYNRNSALAANSWFNNASRLPKPCRLTNLFGGSIGGPILRDKLFFYSYFDGFRQKLQSARNTTVLRPDARNGIFTYVDAAGNRRQLNILQAAGVPMDPAVRQLLDRVPTTVNFPSVGDGRNTGGYRINQRDNRTRDNVGGRLDFHPSARHHFSGTYSWNRDIIDRPDQEATFNIAPMVTNDDHSHLVSASWQWAPTRSFTNELRGGFNLAPITFVTAEGFGPALFTGFIFTNPVNNTRNEGRDTDTYNFMNNAAWQRGRHAVRFGWQSQLIRLRQYSEAGITPTYTIGISTANQRGLQVSHFPGGIGGTDLMNANALLASLAGFVTTATQTFNVTDRSSGFVPNASTQRHNSLNSLAFYGTDQWRIRPTLTLNYGLRWEYFGRYDERDGLMLQPVLANGNVIQTLLSNATVDFAGSKVGRPLYRRDLNNFAPNIGLAWDPFRDGKTALRLGYSINYVNDETIVAAENAVVQNSGLRGVAGLANLSQTISGGLPQAPTPRFQVPRTFRDQLAANPVAAGFAIHPNLVTPYLQQWHFGIQRELPWQTALDVRYVGNKGTALYRGLDYNQTIIRENGFLADFQRARNNGFLAQARGGAFDPAFNAGIPGSERLTVFPNLASGGLLTNATVRGLIQTGETAELASIYFQNALGGTVPLVPNPNIFVADLLENSSSSTYHALQVELNRRLSRGMFLNANYTWSKVLTDSPGTNQVRFDPMLDMAQPRLERARPEYDTPHAFKTNFRIEMPFGRGHRWTPANAVLNKVISGWNVSSIVIWRSGNPFGILSARGTLNRAGRSGQNTATSLLSAGQIKDLFGVQKTGNGVYFIDPGVIGPDSRAVARDGAAPFSGQVFFNPGPGEVGQLERRMFNGPTVFDWDFAVFKETRISESKALEFRVEFFSFPNNPVFFISDQNINSTTFGRMTGTVVSSRFIQTSLRLTF